MKTILVIGASSFVGTYLISELLQSKEKYRIIGTGRNPKFKQYYEQLGVDYIYLDIDDENAFANLKKYQIDQVVLCAVRMPANIGENEDDDLMDYYNTNVISTCRLLEFCRKNGVERLIAFGSRFDTRLYPPTYTVTEQSPLNFSYTDDHAGYVLSNIAKQQVLTYYNEKYGMKNIMFRLPTIIGLGPHGFYNKDGVPTKSGLQIFIDNAIEGRNIEIFGDPETLKDWFYVKDLAIAIRQSIESDKAKGFFNIGYGHNFTLIEIVQAIVDVFSPKERKSQIILRRDLSNNGFFSPLDISQITENVGFMPQYGDPKKIFLDYKKELERGVYSQLFVNHQ